MTNVALIQYQPVHQTIETLGFPLVFSFIPLHGLRVHSQLIKGYTPVLSIFRFPDFLNGGDDILLEPVLQQRAKRLEFPLVRMLFTKTPFDAMVISFLSHVIEELGHGKVLWDTGSSPVLPCKFELRRSFSI